MLEAALGFPVFERSRRRVELTPAGATLLAHPRRVFEVELGPCARRGEPASAKAVAWRSVTSRRSLQRDHRALASVPHALPERRRRPPRASPAEQLGALKAGRLDVGFVRGTPGEPLLATECVRREALVAVLPDHRTELLVAWRKGTLPPVLQGFLDLVRQVGVGERTRPLAL
jgi:DNA-binding transcriptional LysR family regulator